GDFGRSGLGVIHAGKVRHGLGTLVAATDGHMGGFVGAQDGERMLQRFEFATETIEFLEGHALAPEVDIAVFHSAPKSARHAEAPPAARLSCGWTDPETAFAS